MSQFIVTISDQETEKEFLDFVSTHSHMEAKPSVETNVDIYDENGNFKWIPLIKPGINVPKEYMEWRLKEAERKILNGEGKTWDEVKGSLAIRRKEAFGK